MSGAVRVVGASISLMALFVSIAFFAGWNGLLFEEPKSDVGAGLLWLGVAVVAVGVTVWLMMRLARWARR